MATTNMSAQNLALICVATAIAAATGQCGVGQRMSDTEYRCVSCPTGQWQPQQVYYGLICYGTPAGFIPSADQGSIQPCPAKTFNPFQDSTVCIACSTNEVPGLSECPVFVKDVAQVAEIDVKCGPGTCVDLTKTSCQKCPAGQWQNKVDYTHDTCMSTLPGYYALSDSTNYEPCGPGSFSDTTGATACKKCMDGTWSAESVNTQCFAALPGYYAKKDHTGQAACDPGRYAHSTGNTECKLCAPGSRQPNPGSPSCLLCSGGYNMPDEGSAEKDCKGCLKGTFAGNKGASECAACPPGTLNMQIAASGCNLAPEGYIPNADHTDLIACSKGTFAAGKGNSVCTSCKPGSSSNSSQAGHCELCAPGRAMPETGSAASFCRACNNGTHAEGLGNAQCEKCSAGSYTEAQGSAALDGNSYATCELCHAGSFQSVEGTSTCEDCRAGGFSLQGASVCELCGTGKYSAQSGVSYCLKCSSGGYTTGPGKSKCHTCFAFDAALGFSYPDQCIPPYGWIVLLLVIGLCVAPCFYKYYQYRRANAADQPIVITIAESIRKPQSSAEPAVKTYVALEEASVGSDC